MTKVIKTAKFLSNQNYRSEINMEAMGSDSDNLKCQLYVEMIRFRSRVHPVQLYCVWPICSLGRAHIVGAHGSAQVIYPQFLYYL